MLPALAFFLLNVVGRQEQLAQRIQISQTTSSVFDELRYELQHAQSVSVTGSSFGTNPSSLRFIDRNGVVNIITSVSDTSTVDGVSRTVNRLRITQGVVTSFMTGNEVTVDTFTVNYVRNIEGDLTGLNIDVTIEPLVTMTTAQSVQSLTLSTTIWFNAYVQET